MFEVIAAPYLERPKEAERQFLRAKDDALGFGAAGVVELLTPVAALVCSGVVGALAQELSSVAVGRMRARLPWRRRNIATPPLSWDSQRLTAIRATACVQAERLGRTPSQAEELADAVISTLTRGEEVPPR
ncbi:hypothetical protein ACH4SP_04960 [Streptomyces sp. NPDC021093]|uniref:hypothetical protein n=1 Tax=Streptomyces sp. NPDC021093 TaxID=3365112 RepID=UPI003790245D